MGKKIVVAGAGHGGIAAAALLSEKGCDVTVIEKKQRDELGYDWVDAVDLKAFSELGLPVPAEGEFDRNGDMLFYNPALSSPVLSPSNGNGSAKIERKKIYDDLIEFAENRGVKFVYGTAVLGPVMNGYRVIGIETSNGFIQGDLVIDAAGLNSPVRQNLPVCCNIRKSYKYGEALFAYRAFYNKADAPEPRCNYEVFLVHEGYQGISWVVTEKDCVDILIGRMYPLSVDEAKETVERMKKFSPQIGSELLRGGTVEQIPITSPLPIMVCDGYASIGDSAFMTVPMNGSGICASLRAAKILAEVVLNDREEKYSTESLWEYNVKYIKHFGASFASIDVLKNVLLSLPASGMDFLFDKRIISESDLDYSNGSPASAADMMGRVARGAGRLPVLLRTAGALSKGDALKKVYRSIPEQYDRTAVLKWAKDVESAHVLMERPNNV